VDTADIITTFVVLIVSGAVGVVLYKLNGAIRLLNNRMNILSHTQANLLREVQSRLQTQVENPNAAREAELRRRLDRDFR
jgi:hypothetical protein